MRRSLVLVLALACGLTVANLYYSQPLLDLISRSFHVSQGSATIVVTLTQIGYALGMLFLVPLADLLENKRLATGMLVLTAVTSVLVAVVPAYPIFLILSVLLGTTSVVAQILVPLAAHLAPEAERGALVGKVMSGLLLGILLARTVSSFVAGAWGWRAIYYISAAMMIGLGLVLRRMLPERRPGHSATYGALLRSVGQLIADEPALRRRALNQAAMFGAFSAYWTAIAYELIDEHGFTQPQIALFALAGAGGAAAAPLAGRIADRGWGRAGSGAMLVLAVLMLLLAAAGHRSIILLALAGVLLDFAVQSHGVMSQHEIYALRADARARINSVYVTATFAGGAITSALVGVLHNHFGWTGACLLGALFPFLAIPVWAFAAKPKPTPALAR